MCNCIQTGVNDDHDIDEHVFLEGSWEHATRILDTVIGCFFVMSKSTDEQKHSVHWKHKGNFYLHVAKMLLSLKKKMFGENHPNVEEAYWSLAEVHRLLGNKDKASNLRGNVRQFCEEPVNSQCLPQAKIDLNWAFARRCKDVGNDYFKSKDYSNALEYYHIALNQFPSDPKLLTNRAITYVRLSEEQARLKYHKTDNAKDQRFIQCALLDADEAITTDPSWVKGYYWKAVCLAKLGLRGPSLAAAAVAAHLFPPQCADISEVVERFGSYSANVISTIDDLSQASETTPDSKNIVILLKEGRYELPKPVNVPANAVMVGMGKVQIICKKSVPLHMDSTVYVEKVELSPSRDSIKAFKEKAKEKLQQGLLDEALSLYSSALATCPENPQLLTARAATYLKSAEEKKNMYQRESLLELALKDSESSIRADHSWLLGYSFKATILAELERKHEALASAAVFDHLSSGRDITSVIQRYGALNIHVVKCSGELRIVLQEITEREEVNQIVLLKEGDYLLEKTVEMKQAIVVAGLGKVTVSCKTGVPFHFRKEHVVENVALHNGCNEEPTSHEARGDDSGQEEDISLDLPSGYDTSSANNECKVN